MTIRRHFTWMLAILVLAGAGLGASPRPARADGLAMQFLKSLEGNFRGKGTVKFYGRDSAERVICKLSNHYDGAAGALVVAGDCASTQAKSPVDGRISANGDKVSGMFISSVGGTTITKSYGSVSAGRMVITTNLVDNATGNLTRIMQVMRRSAKGFDAEFYTFSNASGRFERTGTMQFSGS